MKPELKAKIDETLRKIKERKGEFEPLPEPEVKLTVTPEQLTKIEKIVKPTQESNTGTVILVLIAALYLFISVSLISDWASFVGTQEYHAWVNRVKSEQP